MALPADIIFAQKASACVKAAGLDPRTMDLRKFRTMAVTIFTRAYQGIYKEYDGIISDPLNAEEQASNAQKVINGLLKKTGNEALVDITGQDVVTGSHKAIGILVGVLYGEGNRLWLEKLEKLQKGDRTTEEDEHTGHTTTIDGDGNDVPKKKKTIKKIKKRRKKHTNDNNGEDVPESDGQDDPQGAIFTGGDDREEYTQQIQEDYRAIAMAQMGGIRRKRPKSAPSTRIASSQSAICDRLVKANSKPPRQIVETLTDQAHFKPWLPPNPDPSSQPSSPVVKPLPNHNDASFPAVTQSDHSFPSEPHTYDPISGRKITLAEYQLKMAELLKKRKQDAMGNLKNASDHFGENGENDQYRRAMNDQNLPPVPTKPVWPGPSTGKSVEKFVKRMLVARVGEEILDPNSQPRFYQAYNLLGIGDLIISIEHCHHCEHHCATLRHDAMEYIRKADYMLRTLAQIAHDCGICARVGVIRVRSRISSKSKTTDAGSRIGAFEVQIACRTTDMQVELLHSKLVTRRWPSKTVIEKRLRAFISQCRVPSHAIFDGSDSQGYGTEGIGGNYPIGNALWEDTPLADETWKFPELCEPVGGTKGAIKTVVTPSPKDLLAAAVSNAPTNSGEIEVISPSAMDDSNAPGGENRGLHVQWVYDAREIIGPVKGGQMQGGSRGMSGNGGATTTTTSQVFTSQSSRPRPKSASSAPSSSSKMVSTSSSHNHMNTNGSKNTNINGSIKQSTTSASTNGTETVLEQLQRIAIDLKAGTMTSWYESIGTLAYDNPVVLVKKGVIYAETIASCQLLREILRQYRYSIENDEKYRNGTMIMDLLKSTDSVMQNLFDLLDRRQMGNLSIVDLDVFLQVVLGKSCTSEALRLIFLSFDTDGDGEISLEEFSAFFTRNFPHFSSDQDNDSDELGVIWARLRHTKPQNDIIEILHTEMQKSNTIVWDLKNVENLFTMCGLSATMEEIGTGVFSAYFMKIWEIRNEQYPQGGVYDMGVFMTWLQGDHVMDLGRGEDGINNDQEDEDGALAMSEKGKARDSQPLFVGEPGVSKQILTGVSNGSTAPIGTTISTPGNDTNKGSIHNNPSTPTPTGTSVSIEKILIGLDSRQNIDPVASDTVVGLTNVNQNFEARELVIKSVRLRGNGLKKHIHDFVHVNLSFSMSQHTREVLLYVPSMAMVPSSSSRSMATMGGETHHEGISSSSSSEERIMSVDWSALPITKEEFDDKMNHAGLTVTYSPASTTPVSKVTVLVPFVQFYAENDAPFEVIIPISLSPAGGVTTGGSGGGSSASSDDEVVIVLSGTAYESSDSKAHRIRKMTVEQLAHVVFAPLDESNDSPKNSSKNGPLEDSLGELSPDGSPKKEVKFLANGRQADSLYGAFERFDDDGDEDVNGLIQSATSTVKTPTVVSTTTPTDTTKTSNTTITPTNTTTSALPAMDTTTKTPSKLAPLPASSMTTTPVPAPIPVTDPTIVDTPGPDYEADFSDDDDDDDLYVEEEG